MSRIQWVCIDNVEVAYDRIGDWVLQISKTRMRTCCPRTFT